MASARSSSEPSAVRVFGNAALAIVTPIFAVVLLIVSEVLPKNVGVAYRKKLQPLCAVYPLIWLRRLLTFPVTWISATGSSVCSCAPTEGISMAPQDEEILLPSRRARRAARNPLPERIEHHRQRPLAR